jgi:hypothetical protein
MRRTDFAFPQRVIMPGDSLLNRSKKSFVAIQAESAGRTIFNDPEHQLSGNKAIGSNGKPSLINIDKSGANTSGIKQYNIDEKKTDKDSSIQVLEQYSGTSGVAF